MHEPTEHWIDITTGFDAGHADRVGRTSAAALALRAGDRAPDFRLSDQDGHIVSLSDRLQIGPAVLFFLGGGREAGAGAQLQALAAQSAQIAGYGASILALSPWPRPHPEPECLFSLLHDAGSAVAATYGLCLPPTAVHPPGPIPATFVVDMDATIVMSLVDASFDSDLVPANVVGTLAAMRRRGSPKP